MQTYCHDCNAPLLARYDLARATAGVDREGWVRPDERVVLFNTGSRLKYLES